MDRRTFHKLACLAAMPTIGFHMLKSSFACHELGGNYLGGNYMDQINKNQLQHYFLKVLQKLGLEVTVQPAPDPA
jgi:hypothetical protein